MGVTPRHVICALGEWTDQSQVADVVHRRFPGFELCTESSQWSPDSRMPGAFLAFQDRLPATLTVDDHQAIRNHRSVAYVLSPPMERGASESISGQTLLLIAELLQHGATAVKSESAGLAHGRQHWLELASDYESALATEDEFEMGSVLYRAFVQRGITDAAGNVYTAGMHLLGHPDIEICEVKGVDAILWADLLGLYLTADKPEREIRDGEGFRLSVDGPRRVIRQVSCERFESDDISFNPYGYNRLEPDAAVRKKPWWRFW